MDVKQYFVDQSLVMLLSGFNTYKLYTLPLFLAFVGLPSSVF